MCHYWSQEYTECSHISRKLINCPTYHKQQSSAKGFFGRLFHGDVRDRKHCGRVIPYHSELTPFCPDCTVRTDQLRAKCVGESALKVFRPDLDDDFRRPFREYREKRRQAAEMSPTRLDKHAEHGKSRHRHVAMDTAHGVWVPELYHHPEMLAGKETCSRTTEAAARTNSSRPNRPPTRENRARRPVKGEKKPQVCERSSLPKPKQKFKNSHKQSRHDSTRKGSARDHPRCPQGSARGTAREEPTHHHQRRRGVTRNSSPIPAPKPPLKPPPPRTGYDTNGNRSDPKHYTIHHKPLPSIPRRHTEASRSESSSQYSGLHQDAGQVYDTRPPRPPRDVVPLPAYQVYLNALRNPGSEFGGLEPSPRPPPKKKRYTNVAEELRNLRLRRMMGIAPSSPDSAISDVSFVCQDSKRLTNDARPPMQGE